MALSHAIMTALLEDELSGYELAKDFDVSLGLFWHASHQQLYQELHKLADKGWLRRETVDGQAGQNSPCADRCRTPGAGGLGTGGEPGAGGQGRPVRQAVQPQ